LHLAPPEPPVLLLLVSVGGMQEATIASEITSDHKRAITGFDIRVAMSPPFPV
jgi:hypothetical protein